MLIKGWTFIAQLPLTQLPYTYSVALYKAKV